MMSWLWEIQLAARNVAPYITVARLVGQGLGKIADKARTEVENGIQELSQACLLRQEKEVTQLQWAVAQLVNSANVEVEKQVGLNLY